MPGVFESFAIALGGMASVSAIALLLAVVIIGLLVGAIPGMGGSVLLILLIPFLFGMDKPTFALVTGAALGAIAFGGSISAILINTPGTGANAATILDGYPMARQGRANEAIGISATASALGAIFGLVVLIIILPFARELILVFGPPEFFWIGILGLTVIASISRGRMLKGLLSGGLGLMTSFVGFSLVSGEYRFGFGTVYLYDGIQLIPALVGLFAIGEIISLMREGGSVSKAQTELSLRQTFKGVRFVFSRPLLLIRSSVIGTLIGMIPGAGAAVATFIAYIQARESSSDPDSFGHGNPEGVLATEAANDAKDGGALLPTALFGVPGSPAFAVLLGLFVAHGIIPGREMMNEQLPILATLIVALLFSNVITSVVGISLSSYLAYLTRVPVKFLVPIILVVSMIGPFSLRNNMLDVGVTLVFGVIGFALLALNYSRIAFILGLILGPFVERFLFISLQMSDSGYLILFTRPIALALVIITVVVLFYPYVRARFMPSSFERSLWSTGPDVEEDPSVSVPDTARYRLIRFDTRVYDVAFIVFSLAFVTLLLALSVGLEPDSRFFPIVLGVPTAITLVGLLAIQVRGIDEVVPEELDSPLVARVRSTKMIGWVGFMSVSILLLGMLLGVAAFVFAYTALEADRSLPVAAGYSAALTGAVFLMFEYVISTAPYQGLVLGALL